LVIAHLHNNPMFSLENIGFLLFQTIRFVFTRYTISDVKLGK